MMRHPVQAHGITRWVDDQPRPRATTPDIKERSMPLLRHEIGDVLRDVRQLQGRTLREVSHDARVSLGYLSEVERGQKEASSELLASICQALEIPLSYLLREVSDRLVDQEGIQVPDTLPDDLTDAADPSLGTLAGR
ncbi:MULTISPECIES: helix-turn-helix domain-containing protein [Micrococcus]|uniref:Transcriptional regulator with XRE-family HTH domain n=1 Tax=Micrococcus endophyticus TaxID=455343 RepID=A0A7W9JIL2_9MICC|nr:MULTISPECIES: helix-turn-helix transcriptional regulator [Micrococcus]MBB5848575.1 transcriptional regulator with XRE-family HTH domain [Micrococcus endophyticus]